MLTLAQMLALPHHPGWGDGRTGYQWCRFDAVVDTDRLLRAEITWDDDQDELCDGTVSQFTDPELLLESNRLVENGQVWQTVNTELIKLTEEDALRLIQLPPAHTLSEFAAEWERLLARPVPVAP